MAVPKHPPPFTVSFLGSDIMLYQLKCLFKGFIDFFVILFQRRSLILDMAKRDIAAQYSGSLLGFFWTFINPLAMISILWLVFSVGFKAAPQKNVPFVVWLTAAIAIWNTFSEAINGSTATLVNNAHLVKKVLFPLSILPVVKLVGSFITHFVFLLVLVVLIICYGMPFSFFWFQALYYFLAMSVLAVGISWITSSINVFARDTGQIVNVALMFGFYCTPIFWDLQIMPERLRFFFKLNPMLYIVQGYRDSFIYFVPFWHDWQLTLYFWCATFLIFLVGAVVFLRLRPHFADVL